MMYSAMNEENAKKKKCRKLKSNKNIPDLYP